MTTLSDKLNAAIDAGFTIRVATSLRVTVVTPKARAAWRRAGFEFFKTADDGALLMIEGQSKGRPRYVAVIGSRIEAVR